MIIKSSSLARQFRCAYSSTPRDRRYETGRTDGASAHFIKCKYKLHRNEIKGKRLTEIKACSREVMDQGRAMVGELRSMKGSGWEIGPMTYTSAVSVFASYGLSKWAHRMVEEMINEGISPTIETYNALLWAYAENGEMRGLNLAWTQLKEQGLTPNGITYNVIVMGLIRGGHKDVVFKMFDLMIEDGMKPDVQFYNSLITACDTAEEGWAVVEKMQKNGIFPDQFSFYFILKLNSREGDVRGAEDTLRQISSFRVTPTAGHWSLLLTTYRTAGDYEGCTRVWERMKDAGVKPNAGTLTELFRAQEMHILKNKEAKGESTNADLIMEHLKGESGSCVKTIDDLKKSSDEFIV